MNPSNISSTSPLSTSSGDSSLAVSSKSGGFFDSASQKLKGSAQDTAEKLKTTAAETAAHLRERAAEMASKRKEGVADRLDGIGHAVHDSAKTLEEKDPNIAWLTHRTAERLEAAAAYVRSRDLSGLRTDAENLARRHPLAFLGGLFVVGLVVGNLVKATRPASPSGWDEDDLSADNPDAAKASESAKGAETWSAPSLDPSI